MSESGWVHLHIYFHPSSSETQLPWHPVCFPRLQNPLSKRVYMYRIYPAIRRGFFVPLEWLQIATSVPWNFAIIPILPFLNNPKDLDPSYKTDLDLWDCFGRKKSILYNWRNMVLSKERICPYWEGRQKWKWKIVSPRKKAIGGVLPDIWNVTSLSFRVTVWQK